MNDYDQAIDFLIGEYETADKKDLRHIADIKEDISEMVKEYYDKISDDLMERAIDIIHS